MKTQLLFISFCFLFFACISCGNNSQTPPLNSTLDTIKTTAISDSSSALAAIDSSVMDSDDDDSDVHDYNFDGNYTSDDVTRTIQIENGQFKYMEGGILQLKGEVVLRSNSEKDSVHIAFIPYGKHASIDLPTYWDEFDKASGFVWESIVYKRNSGEESREN